MNAFDTRYFLFILFDWFISINLISNLLFPFNKEKTIFFKAYFLFKVPMEVSHGRSFLDCSVSGNHISQITIMHAYQTCIKRIVRFANSLQVGLNEVEYCSTVCFRKIGQLCSYSNLLSKFHLNIFLIDK